jgi:hypothetical protein
MTVSALVSGNSQDLIKLTANLMVIQRRCLALMSLIFGVTLHVVPHCEEFLFS